MAECNKVVTITLNPALDLTGSLDSLNVGSVSLVNKSNLHAAGKGVNVAQVLNDLGAEVTVTGFLGRDNQEMFCQLFDSLNINDQFIRVNGATRINVKLVEQSDTVSDINFPGVAVSAEDISQFESVLFELAQSHEYFVLAGSLPQGISPELCATWIDKLNALGKKVFFDSSREALKEGLKAKPWLIKPNDEELSYLVEKPITSLKLTQHAAEEIAKDIPNTVVSLGADGVLWHDESGWLKATPPSMQVVSTVGAGDTLVAGLCWGHMNNQDKHQILSFATALSALAVEQIGVGVKSINNVKQLQKQIQVTSLSVESS
ncbi:1-phosphofructokinase [Vibrio sp. S4M6]|uniref:1-phosphofructokinase n=1 Tax=Vibrio sinus TaxID=2946865 RepID=UPI002029BB3C|nr:1-phosphofructokinase [Vibrio sinus]MCL9779850.1 1-phosphofructokinase [Vibrio sinus]